MSEPVQHGILGGLEVLDLSRGIAGPMAAMLLGDHGARVTRIESPVEGELAELSGNQVWQRGKRRAVLDLRTDDDRRVLLALAAHADVVIESFTPGVAARLGVDHETLLALNPRLIHCSITGYGDTERHAGRPALDALVAARTGQMFESRGTRGTTIGRLSGAPLLPGFDSAGYAIGAPRPGPLFSGLPWISLATFYNASVAINAALYARELTGLGQHVHTSMLQGALATTVGTWQRVERADRAGFNSWVFDARAPKGFFRGADGAWTHHWVASPRFVLKAAGIDPGDAPGRISPGADGMPVLRDLDEPLRAAVARLTADEWTERAARAGVPVQRVRSPEEALLDPELERDGSVVAVDGVRMVGHAYGFEKVSAPPIRATATRGAHTAEVRAEAARLATTTASGERRPGGRAIVSPLDGVVVLDLGLAVAGPFGTQLLADLGATVIAVNSPAFDSFFLQTCFGTSCNRGKRSVALDLKHPEGIATLHDLVRRADVLQHNMRYDAAERLGVDYESIKPLNSRLIYCYTRGHDTSRALLPGNDQTAGALAGTSWMEGGIEAGNMPIWPNTSLGDTGNGYLSAIAILQALSHRERTGEGQFVHTSIVNAHLLNASMAWLAADGTLAARPRLDAMQTGWSDRYRVCETADDWLCIALVTDEHVAAFHRLTGGDLTTLPATEWFALLDGVGVPCEIVDPDFVLSLFDDSELIERGWVTSYEHALVGRIDAAGLLFDLDATPGRVQGPPVSVGQHSRAVLRELGYDEARIDGLIRNGAVHELAQ